MFHCRRIAFVTRGALLASIIIHAALPRFFIAAADSSVEKDANNAFVSKRHTTSSIGSHDAPLSQMLRPSEASLAAMVRGLASSGFEGSSATAENNDADNSSAAAASASKAFLPSGLAKKDLTHRVRQVLDAQARGTSRGLDASSSTTESGIDLVGFGSSLSQLLSEWPSLENNIADADSLVTALTKANDEAITTTDGASKTHILGAGKALLSKLDVLVKEILASDEFPRLRNWVLLLLAIIDEILCTCRIPALGQTARSGGFPTMSTMIESVQVRSEGANDDMMRAVMGEIIRDAAVGTDSTDSQIDSIVDGIIEKVIEVSTSSFSMLLISLRTTSCVSCSAYMYVFILVFLSFPAYLSTNSQSSGSSPKAFRMFSATTAVFSLDSY